MAFLSDLLSDPDVVARVARLELPFNKHGLDPYGVQKKDLVRWMTVLGWLYKNYFHVTVEHIEHVPVRGRVMLVGNHSGGVALDGAMVLAAMLLELEPPRLAHAMAEKFINMLPFVAEWASRCGQLTGLPEQAARLLNDDRMLLVFPEGARGTAKLYWERNSLVDFGSGFVRLALSTHTPIVPFAFIGGGDAIPTFMNLYRIGKMFGAPYIPLTPWLLPIPRRVPLKIVFGEPMLMTGSATDEDSAIEEQVESVKQRIAQLIGSNERKALR